MSSGNSFNFESRIWVLLALVSFFGAGVDFSFQKLIGSSGTFFFCCWIKYNIIRKNKEKLK